MYKFLLTFILKLFLLQLRIHKSSQFVNDFISFNRHVLDRLYFIDICCNYTLDMITWERTHYFPKIRNFARCVHAQGYLALYKECRRTQKASSHDTTTIARFSRAGYSLGLSIGFRNVGNLEACASRKKVKLQRGEFIHSRIGARETDRPTDRRTPDSLFGSYVFAPLFHERIKISWIIYAMCALLSFEAIASKL